MDDDYFIGKPLKKNELFYVKNKTVLPAIINNSFKQIRILSTKKGHIFYKNIIQKSKEEQTSEVFLYSKFSTYLFLFYIFKRSSIIVPKFTHNAIPVNVKELKEIYNLVYKSRFKPYTLDSLYRHKECLQFQTLYLSYIFIKYKKKINYISYRLLNSRKPILSNYNYSLLCINTGSFGHTSISNFKTRIVMQYLFPFPTPYEIFNYSSLSYIAYNVVSLMENTINLYNNKFNLINNELNRCKNYINESNQFKNNKYHKLVYKYICKDLILFSNLLFIIIFIILKIYCKK